MGMVREVLLTLYFRTTWSCATNRIVDTSAERACQSNGDKRMETKRFTVHFQHFPFTFHFQHPRFGSRYDQKQLIISDVSKGNKHRVVPKLMIVVAK